MKFNLIIREVEKEYGFSRDSLLATSRGSPECAWARQVAVHLYHTLCPELSWTQIGRRFGRDRTTVRHAHRRVADIRGQGDDLNETLERIEHVCSTTAV